jgi:malate synthase
VEICRAQIWQWIHRSARLLEGPTITNELFRTISEQEMARLEAGFSSRAAGTSSYKTAGKLLDVLVTEDSFHEFMTLIAYNYLS